jgi:hypothetical protein
MKRRAAILVSALTLLLSGCAGSETFVPGEEPFPDEPGMETPDEGAGLSKVPRLTGKQLAGARKLVRRQDLRFKITGRRATSGPAGRILSQRPKAGRLVEPGTVVRVVVSKLKPEPPPPPQNCTPGYSPCLPPASDYDCAGGSGDGPKYTGPVRVTGSDPYGLDADNDSYGCE